MTRSRDGEDGWSIGSGGREEGWPDADFLRPTHEGAAGGKEDQACYRRHREGQATDEEGGMEGWANEQEIAASKFIA
jgi:hypothetical protein